MAEQTQMLSHWFQHFEGLNQSARMVWSWNPRQTGDSTEPDLRGHLDGTVVLSAEVTTSKEPLGTIDKRMGSTLQKLAQMDGALYYFVRTDTMLSRARTKVLKGQWPIEVIKVDAAYS
jgi:hypothetical protein